MTWFRLLVWACSVASSLALGLPNRKLVLVVLDGFSPHYLLNESYPTPHLQSLINKPVEGGFSGTLVRGVRPEFPASKLPFISAVANGRHSLENRVLDEEWLDLESQKVISAKHNPELFWAKLKQTSTLWDGNDEEEKSHKSRVLGWPYSWPQSESMANSTIKAKHQTDITPSPLTQSELKFPNLPEGLAFLNKLRQKAEEHPAEDEIEDHEDIEAKFDSWVNQTKEWLNDESVNFITLYSDEPGRSAEIFGPDSPEAMAAVNSTDTWIGHLIEEGVDLKQHNLVVLTTPGYVPVSLKSSVIDLDNYNPSKSYTRTGSSPVLGVQPTGEDQITLYQKFLPGKSKKHFEVFSHTEFPSEWHFDNVTQLPLITLVAEEGYVFAQDFNQKVHALNKKGNRKSDLSNIYGATGYDNRLESMKTFMVVAGPSFASEPASNSDNAVTAVDIHCLLSHLLGLGDTGMNNSTGSLAKVSYLLRYKPDNILAPIEEAYDIATEPENLPYAMALAIGSATALCCLMTICLVCCCRCMRCCCFKSKTSLDAQFRYTKVHNRRPVAEYRDIPMGEDDEVDTKRLLRDTDLDSALPHDEA